MKTRKQCFSFCGFATHVTIFRRELSSVLWLYLIFCFLNHSTTNSQIQLAAPPLITLQKLFKTVPYFSCINIWTIPSYIVCIYLGFHIACLFLIEQKTCAAFTTFQFLWTWSLLSPWPNLVSLTQMVSLFSLLFYILLLVAFVFFFLIF